MRVPKTPPIRIHKFKKGEARGFSLPNGPMEWKTVLRRDPCAYCGECGGTVDHIIAHYGRNKKERIPLLRSFLEHYGWHMNLTGACHKCNMEKSETELLQFLLLRLSVEGGEVNV